MVQMPRGNGWLVAGILSALGLVAVGGNYISSSDTGLRLADTAEDNQVSIKPISDEAADRTVYMPTLGGDKYLVISATDGGTPAGLGTMSTQNANAVAITGGTVTGITDLAVADGGTGSSTAAAARTALAAAGTGDANAFTAEQNIADDTAVAFGNDDWKLRYDEAGVDSLMLSEATVDTLAIKGSAITNFLAANDTAGNDLFLELQAGGTATAGNGRAGATATFTAGAGSAAFAGGAGNGGAGGGFSFTAGAGGAKDGAGTDGNGGDILVIPGLKAGTGSDGKLIVRQPGGVAGTDELQLYDDGSRSFIETKNGSFRFIVGGTTIATWDNTSQDFRNPVPQTVGANDLGTTAKEWRDLFISGAIKLGTGQDAGLERTAAGVAEITDGSTGLGFLQTAGDKFRAATQAVDSATLTADDTLSATLAASRKYRFRLVYYINVGDTVADGFKLDFNGGTATATTFIAQIAAQDAGATAFLAGTNARVTALNTAFSCTSTTNFMVVAEGAIVVNGAGTFIPKFAKVADVGTGITAQIGSTLTVWDCP